ncbi:glycoside hydrolase family 3 C-terminal domain-containing protein [Geochorda subterranea]|uniref:Glycoside hydrolase family 3 C-terminal domain-containing protein n=1 Tax=Geochorda subterranea TaxID=3109564 RepID=A0ABZ1BNL3_9FIRM|nr:glycoside hydrolase family 3 C-terminal domain-containing protein [Limnochorda sp. LNt]WRP14425.1 glycoside hydrolase family 3 C-terminal domain-containing protein [Limnochorda sp. LNt]
MQPVQELVRQLTLEEKAALCSGATAWRTEAVERLGIPSIVLSDGPHGLRRPVREDELGGPSVPATCFPTASAMACSWDRQLVREVAQALGAEARAAGVHVLLGPGVNMKRTPLCGRNFEYFSEDPYLAGELAAAYVEGLQSTGVSACVKHFAANNQETDRMTVDAVVDERTLREIYLAVFERVIRKARPWSVMCSYNRLNGVYASQHRWLLTEVLREAWGFDGLVVSDWGAVEDRVAGLAAGLDLEMPGPSPANDARIVEAVRTGQLDEAVLDRAVERILTLVQKVTSPSNPAPPVDVDAHHRLARRAAAACMVLLKNEGALLPLQPDRHRSVALLGGMAAAPQFQGGGSSRVNPTRTESALEAWREVAPEVSVSYHQGYRQDGGRDAALLRAAVDAARVADVAVVFVGLPDGVESEGYDRKDMALPEGHVALIREVARVQPRTVVVLHNGAPVDMAGWVGQVPAVLLAGLAGQASGAAAVDVLLGRVNPSGKLAETYPTRLEQTPAFFDFPGEGGHVRYGERVFIGYRYYDARDVEPLFPFGHGLSYTTFAYGPLALSRSTIGPDESLDVTLWVRNTGERAGQEVVQLYVGPRQARVARPVKELKGFDKVALAPGESRPVRFVLTALDLAYYDPARRAWVAEPGLYDILVGASSRDIRVQATVELTQGLHAETRLDEESTVRAWMQHPAGRLALERALPPELFGRLAGQPPTSFLWELPLKKLSLLSQGALDESAIRRVVAALRG